jgi:hypothetical protein
LQTFQGGGFETPAVAVRSIVTEGFGQYSPFDEPSRRVSAEAPRQRRRAIPDEREYDEEERRVSPPRRYAREEGRSGERPRDRRARAEEEGGGREPEVPSDLIGRRCLFHGGVAVARCVKCKAVLCKECIRGSERCPRCNSPLRGDVTPGEDEEQEEEREEATPKRRHQRRREESKSDEISRL